MRGRPISLIAITVATGLLIPNAALAQTSPSSLGATSATAAPPPAQSVQAAEARFVELINGERAKAGLTPLTVVPELVSIGEAWSAQMIIKSAQSPECQIEHNPNYANSVKSNWRRLGENVGCGNVDVDYLHAKFVASPPHYKNIMDPTYDSIGVGIVYDGDVMFVTEQFMDLRDPVTTTKAPAVLSLLDPPAKDTKAGKAKKIRKIRRQGK